MKIKLVSLVLGGVLIAAGLSGCSSGGTSGSSGLSKKSAKVVMMAPEPNVAEEKAAWEEVGKAFEEETGIEVEYRFQGTWDDAQTTLQEAKLAGDQVDIIRIGVGTIRSTLGSAGMVMDLTELAADLTDRYTDGSLGSCYIGDHLWALPYYGASSYMCLYNKDLFEQRGIDAPETYNDLMSVAADLQAVGVTPMVFQGKDAWAWPMLYTETFTQTTGNTAVETVESFLKGDSSFDSGASEQAFGLVKKLFDDGIMTNASLDTDSDGVIASFAQGKAGMVFAGTWDYASIKQSCDFNIGAFEFPVMVSGSVAQDGYGVGDYALAIPSFADNDNLENTMRFLEYITRENNAKKILCTSPMIFEVLKGVTTEQDDVTEFLNSQRKDHSVQYLDWMWPSEVNDAISSAVPAVIQGEMDSAKAAASVDEAYRRVVEEDNYIYDWWNRWSEEEWGKVTPKSVPDISQYMSK
jgi:raffinose/stachyose/melibiose transport system substrate-binding protein